MTALFSKITEQIVKSCQAYLLRDAPDNGTLWGCKFEELDEKLQACKALREKYFKRYHSTKERLKKDKPAGKQFDFPETQVFGKFDLFCRRVNKLSALFKLVDQLSGMAGGGPPDMQPLTDQFLNEITQFRLKGHDLLDYQHNGFDRDFVELNHKIDGLEVKMVQFLENAFRQPPSAEKGIALFKSLYCAISRESIRKVLRRKLFGVFEGFYDELQKVEKDFKKNEKIKKRALLIPRGMPPVAGQIAWIRQIMKEVNDPYQFFSQNTTFLQTSEAKRIAGKFSDVVNMLMKEEENLFTDWIKGIRHAKEGLESPLFVRNKFDKQLYVNFDPEILKLIQETKCLMRMGGAKIPNGAKIVLFQEHKLKSINSELLWILAEYDRLKQDVASSTQGILVSLCLHAAATLHLSSSIYSPLSRLHCPTPSYS
jgi:dynein heavy chain